MKQIILSFFLIVSNFIWAQIDNGQISYKVVFSENQNNELFLQAKTMSDNLEYNLIFDKNGSLFSLQKKMIDELEYRYATILAGEKLIHQDLQTKTLTFNNSEYSLTMKKDEFLLTDSINSNWKLFQESKIIGSYTCYKATTSFIVHNSKGTFTNHVTAWYCPQIPFGYGPAGYGGLPGLILELQVKDILYGAVSINFNQPNIIVKKPSKGKKIALDDFTKISQERSELYRKGKN